MSENTLQNSQIEAALRQLARLLKAVRYYPGTHPALDTAVAEVRQEIRPLLAPPATHFSLKVRKEGFLLDDQPVAQGQPVVGKLALHLFVRRVQSLLFLPDLSPHDLRNFAHCLTLDPATLQELGGMSAILQKARVSTIWVNETDLSAIQVRKEEIEAEASIAENDHDADLDKLFETGKQENASEERDLATLLNELRQDPSDQQYRQLLQEMVPLARTALAEVDRYLVLDAFVLLQYDSADPDRSQLRRGLAAQALSQMATEEALAALIDFICSREATEATREQIAKVLSHDPERTVRRLMDRLAAENELTNRRLLIEALVRQGPAAIPFLTDFLADSRWFVVRNAVAIVGDIRDPAGATLLPPLLRHREIRVAREAIRALTKIGGSRAVSILLSLVDGEDQDLARQALLSLGAMKSSAAVPALVNIVNRPDRAKRLEVTKQAIKTLGEIGDPQAAPTLIAIVERRHFLRRAQHNELRAAAALALGEIGASSAIPVLEKMAEGGHGDETRAALQALRQLKKV